MSIPASRRWRGGEIVFAADRNAYISEFLDALAGRDGALVLENALEVGGTYIRVPSATGSGGGVARVRLSGTTLQYHDGTAWRDVWPFQTIDWFGELNRAGDVGLNAGQIPAGNHSH